MRTGNKPFKTILHSLKRSRYLKNKLSFLIAAAFFSPLFLHAQKTAVISSLPDSVIEQRLVDLVLKGPEMQETEHQARIESYQLKNARNQWTNLLTLSANYNDQTFKTVSSNTAYVYPKYFFGINIPLGTLLSKTQIRSAQESLEIGKLRQEELKRRLKVDVLSKYRQYKAQAEVIALESSLMNDIEAALLEAKDKFRKNQITFEQLNLVQRNYNDEQEKIINLKLQFDVMRISLEGMIGTSLDNVLK